jgi:hypothetical protein
VYLELRHVYKSVQLKTDKCFDLLILMQNFMIMDIKILLIFFKKKGFSALTPDSNWKFPQFHCLPQTCYCVTVSHDCYCKHCCVCVSVLCCSPLALCSVSDGIKWVSLITVAAVTWQAVREKLPHFLLISPLHSMLPHTRLWPPDLA